jgi:DNA replication protein DnaC
MHVNMHCRAVDGRVPRLFKTLTKTQLLILDDWGPDRLNAGQRRDLMEIVEDRYEVRSTLITSHSYQRLDQLTVIQFLLVIEVMRSGSFAKKFQASWHLLRMSA